MRKACNHIKTKQGSLGSRVVYMFNITLLISSKGCVFLPVFGCSPYTDILSQYYITYNHFLIKIKTGTLMLTVINIKIIFFSVLDWWNKPTLHSSGFWILHTYSSCNFAGKIWQQKCTEKIMHASFRSGNWNYCCCHCKLYFFSCFRC